MWRSLWPFINVFTASPVPSTQYTYTGWHKHQQNTTIIMALHSSTLNILLCSCSFETLHYILNQLLWNTDIVIIIIFFFFPPCLSLKVHNDLYGCRQELHFHLVRRGKSSSPPACSSTWPRSCDVLVVGGGAVGSSSAYHLKQRAGKDLSVVVLEQDSTVRMCVCV